MLIQASIIVFGHITIFWISRTLCDNNTLFPAEQYDLSLWSKTRLTASVNKIFVQMHIKIKIWYIIKDLFYVLPSDITISADFTRVKKTIKLIWTNNFGNLFVLINHCHVSRLKYIFNVKINGINLLGVMEICPSCPA